MNTTSSQRFFITPEPLELLKNIIPVYKISLGAFLGQNHMPIYFLRLIKMIHFELYSNFTDKLHGISTTDSYPISLRHDLTNF